MAVPDLALICEIMLMAEGFQQSKLLSRKFIILYKLCEDLLSKVRLLRAAAVGSGSCSRREGGGQWMGWHILGTAAGMRLGANVRVAGSLPMHAASPPALPPAAAVQALRLEAARHQDHAVRGGRHEACCARAQRGQGEE